MSNGVPRSSGSGRTAGSASEADTMNVSAPVAPDEGGAPTHPAPSRYMTIEELGRGGMGRVLRAYDPTLQREVALKEVRREALSEEATARLVAEARAMAKLSHPNVVAVYDVDQLTGPGVVLVMEYVEGQTLRQWLQERDRPWREIVDRFVAAGRGLAAAHAAGLLHRDFKPANVLVDAHGPVKVTDFGLAKLHGEASSSGSTEIGASDDPLTEAGVVMGTPRYMAPEQHVGKSLTAAADQYALCVALWEALCGTPPFSGATMAQDKRSGPPRWPTGASTVPRPIANAITKGLSPQPRQRWPSMDALLQALAYDPRRRRRRWLLGVGASVVLGGVAVSWSAWAEIRARRCSGAQQQLAEIWDPARSAQVQTAILGTGKPYAEDVWTRTQRQLDDYAKRWVAMHTDACEATTLRGKQSPQMLDLRMACLHRAAQQLQATVDTLADADDEVVRHAHELTAGLRPLGRCADPEALAAQVEPPLPADAEAVEATRLNLARADALQRAGRYRAALEAVQQAERTIALAEYGPARAEVALQAGLVHDDLRDPDAAEAALRESLQLALRWRQRDTMAAAATELMYVIGYQQRRIQEGLRYMPLTRGLSRGKPRHEALMRESLGSILHGQGRYAEAEAEQRAALSLWEQIRGPEDLQVAMARNNLGSVLQAEGKFAEAESQHRMALSLQERVLGRAHPDVAMSRTSLGTVLQDQERFDEAEVEHRAALAIWEEALGPDHPYVAVSRNNLANVLDALGKYEQAETEYRATLSLLERTLGSEHPDVALTRANLGSVLYVQGKHAEAEAEVRAALAVQREVLGADHPHVANSRNNLANILSAQGKYEQAELEARGALAIWERALGPEHPSVGGVRINIGTIVEAQGKYAEAEAEYRAALAIWEPVLGPEHGDVALARNNLAAVLLELDRPAEALPLAEQAWLRRQSDDIPPELRAGTALLLARALWTVDGPARDRGRARELAVQAVQGYRQASVAQAEQLEKARRWLETHQP